MRPRAGPLLVIGFLLLAGCTSAQPKGQPDPGGAVTAAFDFSPSIPKVNEPVRFQDRSEGPVTDWQWDFGDGAKASARAATHAYSKAGLFEVRLVVTGSAGKDVASRFIQVGESKGGAGSFSIDFRFEAEGLSVEFEPRPEPASTVVDQYFWEFGDGDVSRESAPRHTYAKEGRFEVSLRAIAGGSFANATHVVTVGNVPGPAGPLSDESLVVIAIVDTGVNPYHEEFRDAAFDQHPSTFIEGYPAEAPALDLDLGAEDYDEAVESDEATWKGVKANQLYWIPGTRIIGAISVSNPGPVRILDDHSVAAEDIGHGTLTASDAAGATIGTCPTCVIVVVEALGPGEGYAAGLSWALSQPWIDVVSNSWGVCLVTCDADTGLIPPPYTSGTRAAVERGVEVFFASGNGVLNGFDAPQLTYWNAYTGPDWIVTVGAADAASGAIIVGTGRPVDIVSLGWEWKGAVHTSMSSIKKWSGTSAATPVAAGAYASVVLAARKALLDTKEGPHGGVAVGANGKGFLSDGKLTRYEAERALFLTASTQAGTGPLYPASLPGSAAAFAYRGYGLVNHASAKEAIKVVLGEKTADARTAEDQWAAVDSQVRRAVWGNWNSGGGGLAATTLHHDAWLAELGLTGAAVAAPR